MNKDIKNIELWYDEPKLIGDRILNIIFHVKFNDGKSSILHCMGEKIDFESYYDGESWLIEDEYSRIDNLVDDIGIIVNFPDFNKFMSEL